LNPDLANSVRASSTLPSFIIPDWFEIGHTKVPIGIWKKTNVTLWKITFSIHSVPVEQFLSSQLKAGLTFLGDKELDGAALFSIFGYPQPVVSQLTASEMPDQVNLKLICKNSRGGQIDFIVGLAVFERNIAWTVPGYLMQIQHTC
jgi:hypothetical protein